MAYPELQTAFQHFKEFGNTVILLNMFDSCSVRLRYIFCYSPPPPFLLFPNSYNSSTERCFYGGIYSSGSVLGYWSSEYARSNHRGPHNLLTPVCQLLYHVHRSREPTGERSIISFHHRLTISSKQFLGSCYCTGDSEGFGDGIMEG